MAIDNALSQSPADFEELLKLLQEYGCEVSKRGKSYRLKLSGWEKAARMDSLGEGYGLEDLRAVLLGKKAHTPRKKTVTQAEPPKDNLLVDIQAKLQAGKGAGYARWAKVFNLKQMAQIKAAEKRMAEIAVLRTHIVNYAKTREVYVAYRKAGYSKKFREEHEEEILFHQAAKNAFDEMGVKKLPKVKELQTEYAKLLEEKEKTTASGKLVLVKSVRRTRSHRMKFCVQRGLGALPSTSKRRGKSRRDFLLCGPVCINTGIAWWG